MNTAPPDERPFRFDSQNSFLQPLVEMLSVHPKRVVFPEGNDPRVLRVAAELVRLECVSPILIGNRREIEHTAAGLGVSMEFIGVVQPEDSSDFQAYCERYRRTERLRKRTIRAPEETIALPHYFAAMMVQYGAADAVVGGNKVIPAAFFRALFHLIKRQEHLLSVTSCMAVRLPHRPDLGDCAVIPTPTVAQLADIAVETAKVAGPLLQDRARIAMLSFSTKGSARNLTTDKMQAATQMARLRAAQQQVPMDVDGELQLDAAIVPAAAERKSPQSLVAGRANILVFRISTPVTLRLKSSNTSVAQSAMVRSC
jgi:phosphotransacetylase